MLYSGPGRSGYAVVVGGINVDIGGKSLEPLVPGDSNPGTVTVSIGGVGYNIARDLCLLGVSTCMLGAVGQDAFADKVIASGGACGLDMSHIRRVSGAATSTYLYLTEPSGDMVLAVNDMQVCKQITPEYLEGQLSLLNGAQVVAADANIPEEALSWLVAHVNRPLFADPVSAAKAGRLRPVLGRLHTLKPNRLEAELLTGHEIKTEGDLRRAAEALLSTGLRRVFISLGGEGVYAADRSGGVHLPCIPARVQSLTGAGDAMTAGLVWAWLQDCPLTDAALAGMAAASIAAEGDAAVQEALCERAVLERIKRRKSEQEESL